MTPEEYEETRRICFQARKLDPGERQAFLAKACGDRKDLRELVANLLRHESSAEVGNPEAQTSGLLLPRVPSGPSSDALLIARAREPNGRGAAAGLGELLDGRYRVVRQLGEGSLEASPSGDRGGLRLRARRAGAVPDTAHEK